MSKSTVVTARLDPETLGALDRLAEYQDRSRSWLVAKAVERYVREEEAFLDFIQEGKDAIARGESVPHEELVAELKALKELKTKRAA